LDENVGNDLTGDAGKVHFASLEADAQAGVVDAEKPQCRSTLDAATKRRRSPCRLHADPGQKLLITEVGAMSFRFECQLDRPLEEIAVPSIEA
jgi:hypothetical protein